MSAGTVVSGASSVMKGARKKSRLTIADSRRKMKLANDGIRMDQLPVGA